MPDRNDRVDHGRSVHVHEVERLRTVAPAGATALGDQVLRVAGRAGDRDGDPGELRRRRVVQVATDDRDDVGPLHHLGECLLVAQFDEDRQVLDTRHGRVVEREDGAVRRRHAEFLGEPVELRGGQFPVVVARDTRVERDHPEPVDVVHEVHGPVGGLQTEQLTPERATLVVVAHRPDELGTESFRRRFEDAADPCVRSWLTAVRDVARDDDGLGVRTRRLDLVDDLLQPRSRVDVSVQLAVSGDEVGVGEVEQEVVRPGVFGRPDVHGARNQSLVEEQRGQRCHSHVHQSSTRA